MKQIVGKLGSPRILNCVVRRGGRSGRECVRRKVNVLARHDNLLLGEGWSVEATESLLLE